MTDFPQADPRKTQYHADPQISKLGIDGDAAIGDAVSPAIFPDHILRYRNERWDQSIGLDGLTEEQWIDYFGTFHALPYNLKTPVALRYHGHQFRNYNPQIGDGRGFLFAQMRDHEKRLMDLATKGSGTTPWSRTGDGKLTLKGGVREVLATEMLEALGLFTSKSFSLIETKEELWREDEPSPARSAVLVRLSHSHIRIGSFQRIAFERDEARMAQLVRYCLEHYYPDNGGKNTADIPDTDAGFAAILFNKIIDQAAILSAGYMATGFVHGVLNTDNINITGESFDYGPWRFTPYWEPGFTAAYFDQEGLYCFARQPEAIHWNMAQLASALHLICESEPLVQALERFPRAYGEALVRHFFWRLGLPYTDFDKDRPLVMAAEKALSAKSVTIDQFFHDWAGCAPSSMTRYDSDIFAEFRSEYIKYKPDKQGKNGYWQREEPCSMHIEEVEDIWAAIADKDDWQPFNEKIAQIRHFGAAIRALHGGSADDVTPS